MVFNKRKNVVNKHNSNCVVGREGEINYYTLLSSCVDDLQKDRSGSIFVKE